VVALSWWVLQVGEGGRLEGAARQVAAVLAVLSGARSRGDVPHGSGRALAALAVSASLSRRDCDSTDLSAARGEPEKQALHFSLDVLVVVV